MIDTIRAIGAGMEHELVARRRDLHRYAESGWFEFRTASLVARRLAGLGYQVSVGHQVLVDDARMGVPDNDALERNWERARDQGGALEFMEAMRGGFTGLVGTLTRGEGPVVALRFDMDALDINEDRTAEHRPFREGYLSVNEGMMHACGHDAHTAVGLGVAEVLVSLGERLRGTIKLVFQPAEEGVRGAKSMVAAGVLDGVEYLVGHHVRSGYALGEIVCGISDYAATKKFDVRITGSGAHAGSSPESGQNALLAAAATILGLYGIPRHSLGATRVNVGKLVGGTGRNVIPPYAHLMAETRGATTELSDYMYEWAVRVIQSAASMYGCSADVVVMGEAQSARSDAVLAGRVQTTAEKIGGFTFFPSLNTGGSEDFTFMMRRVQEQGGLATNIGVGADFHGISRSQEQGRERVLGGHTSRFDIDERALGSAVMLLSAVALDLSGRGAI